MSARFTYVSPAGTIVSRHGVRRIVDGGYSENSGALTAMEIIQAIDDSCASGNCLRGARIRPIVILLTNSPRFGSASDYGEQNNGLAFLSETVSPIRALFNTRTERGLHAEELLISSGSHVLRFQLDPRETITIPLGWILSPTAQRAMREQLKRLSTEQVGELTKKWLNDSEAVEPDNL